MRLLVFMGMWCLVLVGDINYKINNNNNIIAFKAES